MHYRPSELADEIAVNVDTVYRSYLPAGCPHVRDSDGDIFINGLAFRDWVKQMQEDKKRGRNHAPMPEGQAFCMRCKKRVEMLNPKVKYTQRNMEIVQGRCTECNGKVNRARSTRKTESTGQL